MLDIQQEVLDAINKNLPTLAASQLKDYLQQTETELETCIDTKQ